MKYKINDWVWYDGQNVMINDAYSSPTSGEVIYELKPNFELVREDDLHTEDEEDAYGSPISSLEDED